MALEAFLALPLPPPIHGVLSRSALQPAFRQTEQAPRSPRDAVSRPHACWRGRQAWQAAGGRRGEGSCRSVVVGRERERERDSAAGAAAAWSGSAHVGHRRGTAHTLLPCGR